MLAYLDELIPSAENFDKEYRTIHQQTGDLVWVYGKGVITRNAEGVPIQMMGYIQDITESKLASLELDHYRQELEQMVELRTEELTQVLNGAVEGIYSFDVKGNVILVNPMASKLVGYAVDELKGKNIHALLHRSHEDLSHYPAEDCPIYKSLSTGETHLAEHEILCRKDGSFFPVEYSSTPIRDKNGNIVGGIVIFRDVTERERIEKEKQMHLERINALMRAQEGTNQELRITVDKLNMALEDIQTLLRSSHHEVKNELANFMAILEDSLRKVTDTTTQAILERLIKMVHLRSKLHSLIHQADSIVYLNLQDLLNLIAHIYRYTNEVSVAIASPIIIHASKVQALGMSLNELVLNALEHAFEKGSVGKVLIQASVEEGNVIISVEDNGKGLPDHFDIDELESMGLRFTKESVEDKLGGKFSFTRLTAGMRFSIVFPDMKE